MIKILHLAAIAATAAMLFAATTQAASFDCAKAKSDTEKLICGDAALSTLDEELSRAYKKATANPRDMEFVRHWQRTWLAARTVCGDVACMKPAYIAQIGELNERATRAMAAINYSGKYERHVRGKRDLHSATLTIVELNNDRVRVLGSAVWVGNPTTGAVNVGEISGLVKLTENKISYQEAENAECKFVITFVANGLSVGDDKLNCGGHNVTFSGEYRRAATLK